MKNMKGKVLRKLKFNWKTPLSLHPNTPFPILQTPKEHNNPTIEDTEDSKDNQLISSEPTEHNINIEPEDNGPPGGKDGVVLYTTSLRGIRKTFEDCNTIQFLLQSFKIHFHERDVSMHCEYKEELWRVLGGRVVPPRLFIRGLYIGGADEVVGLHENGMLKNLLQGIPLRLSNGPCRGCGGMHFVLCGNCNGSRKVRPLSQDSDLYVKCSDCNENGLVKCLVCN